MLATCPHFDNNLEFDIFDAGGPQCHFIIPATLLVSIHTLSTFAQAQFSSLRAM